MGQAGHRPRFAKQANPQLRHRLPARTDQLERDVAAENHVARRPDDAHTAGANLLDQLISLNRDIFSKAVADGHARSDGPSDRGRHAQIANRQPWCVSFSPSDELPTRLRLRRIAHLREPTAVAEIGAPVRSRSSIIAPDWAPSYHAAGPYLAQHRREARRSSPPSPGGRTSTFTAEPVERSISWVATVPHSQLETSTESYQQSYVDTERSTVSVPRIADRQLLLRLRHPVPDLHAQRSHDHTPDRVPHAHGDALLHRLRTAHRTVTRFRSEPRVSTPRVCAGGTTPAPGRSRSRSVRTGRR